MKLQKFIKKVNLEKFPNITLHDEFGCYDYDDIVKGGVIKEKVLKEHAEDEVTDESPDQLTVGPCGTYAIHLKTDE